MTESEWLAAETPTDLLVQLGEEVSYRKLRLFSCACVRRVWQHLSEDKYRLAIELTEKLVDGKASVSAQNRAYRTASSALQLPGLTFDLCALSAASPHTDSGTSYHLAHEVTSGISRGIWDSRPRFRQKVTQTERAAQAALLCDIFGNPFRPVVFDPKWRSETVVALAAAIYEERAFDRLPILADAIEEAGCDNADVLSHCRGDGPHARGCWVVDGVLGKE